MGSTAVVQTSRTAMASRGPFPVEGIPRRNLRRSITALPFVSTTGFSDGDGGASNRRQNMVPATDAPLDICSLQSHSSGLLRAVEPKTKMCHCAAKPGRLSAVRPKADIAECDHHVRFVPKADIVNSIRQK